MMPSEYRIDIQDIAGADRLQQKTVTPRPFRQAKNLPPVAIIEKARDILAYLARVQGKTG